MKKLASKLTLLAGALAIAGTFTVPIVRAAAEKPDAAARAEKKAKREAKDAEDLKKYDVNHNGKLDDDEKAAMKADEDKARADKKDKKDKREEKREKKEKKDK